MVKFIYEEELNQAIKNIFKDANEYVLIVSPYIKLHTIYIDNLKTKIDNPNIQIYVLFGKNEGEITKSILIKDLFFFSTFKNVEIRYEPRLHAKFYANEKLSVICSMNLYDYSQNYNIETGMLFESSKNSFIGNLENDAFNYFNGIMDKSELIFKRKQHQITENNIPQYIKCEHNKYFSKFRNKTGYCIRCHDEIKPNPDLPLCNKCLDIWMEYSNVFYSENYCHICGKSNKTNFIKPTCEKCYMDYKLNSNFY